MKNVKYLLLIFFSISVFSFFIVSCSNMLNNEIEIEKLEGRVFKNEEGNKIVFKNNKIFYYYDNEIYLFEKYEIEIKNMISIIPNDIGMEEIRLYLLKDNAFYSTLDDQYYYCY